MGMPALNGLGETVHHENRDGKLPLLERQDAPGFE